MYLNTSAQLFYYDPGYVSVTTGASFALHHFGKKRGLSTTNFAKTGFNITAEATFFHSKNVGFGGLYSFNVNGVDANDMASAYVHSNINYVSASVETENFMVHLGMIGFTFLVPVTKNFAFTFKLLGGFAYVYKPAAVIHLNMPFTSVDIFESGTSRMNFAFYNHIGAKLKLVDGFWLLGELSYVASKFHLDYLVNSKEVSEVKHLGILSPRMGVAYIF